MISKTDLHLRPEFTYELVLGVPYAKWLHDNDMLGTVYTSVGMTPYYYFADNVEAIYTERTVDNKQSGVLELPNTWLHHNAVNVFGKDYGDMSESEKETADGVLDYTRWSPPNYSERFSGDDLKFPNNKPIIVINNQFNIEKGRSPTRYYSIGCLYEMFNMLTDGGYTVVYNRPNNTEFIIDENEQRTLDEGLNLIANVEGLGIMTDYELTEHYDGVSLFKDLLSDSNYSYNEYQLRLFDRADGFIGLVGGAGTLSSFYKKPTIMYATVSRARRISYWTPDSYYQVLSDQNAHPIIDDRQHQLIRGCHDYTELYKKIKELFL